MIIVVDSGSTKTHLVVLNGREVVKDCSLLGINPFYQTENDIFRILQEGLGNSYSEKVSAVYHYGAGCSYPEKKLAVQKAWGRLYQKASVFVESDMLGAAKSVLGDSCGIACILGTGANSCYYDGEKIDANIPPLGFILGDEGSGAYLGKQLVANCMKGIYRKEVTKAFFSYCKCTAQEIMDKVYKQTLPNRYLASFVPFIAENIELNEMNDLVLQSFKSFFERNVLLYKRKSCSLGFVGGVARQFKNHLIKVANSNGFDSIVVLGDPLEGLISYHKQHK